MLCIHMYICIYIYIYMIPARGPQTKFLYDLCRRILCARYIGTFYNTFANICYQCPRVMLAVDRMLVRCCMINAYVYCHWPMVMHAWALFFKGCSSASKWLLVAGGCSAAHSVAMQYESYCTGVTRTVPLQCHGHGTAIAVPWECHGSAMALP